jgi:hypothetical protein
VLPVRLFYEKDNLFTHPKMGDGYCCSARNRAGMEIVCSYSDIEPGEWFDGMCELKTFTWLNWSWPYGEPINVRRFQPKAIL